jgi:hypothetical protein
VKRELGEARSGWREEKEAGREAREEREALKKVLRVIEGENVELSSERERDEYEEWGWERAA